MKRYFIAALALLCAVSCSEQKPVKDYSWEKDLHERLLVDFNKNEEQIKEYIKRYIPDVSDEQMRAWEESQALEYMIIDGQKRYFRHRYLVPVALQFPDFLCMPTRASYWDAVNRFSKNRILFRILRAPASFL